ncbi:MAG: MFS transporter [Simkaniaceae bacterium]|nr:MFS transporter [Simkaniaceae bacterium]
MDRRTWAIFGILLGISVIALDWSVVITALPIIQKEFHASTGQIQWVMNIFGLISTSFMVTFGRLADDFGRRRFLLIGLILFGLGSLIAGLSPSIELLLVGRAIQGLSPAIVIPTTQSLMKKLYHESPAKGVALWSSIIGLFLALGPVVGGVIITLIDWRWIFFINIPVVIVSLLFCALFLRESKNTREGKDLDWFGLFALVFFLVPITLAITQGPSWGWESPPVLWMFILSILALGGLIFIENRVKVPIIDPQFFLHRNFIAGAIAVFSSIFLIWVIFFTVPLFLHNVRGDSPLIVGAYMLCASLPLFILGPLVGRLQEKITSAKLISVGFIILLISVLGLLFFEKASAPWLIISVLILYGIGWAVIWGPSITCGISGVDSDLASLASGALMTIQDFGGVIGLAIAGTLMRMVAFHDVSTLAKAKGLMLSESQVEQAAESITNPQASPMAALNLESIFMEGFRSATLMLVVLMILAMILFRLVIKEPSRRSERGSR